ncbi:RxLR effector family protein [Phytophthora palmivora]|uniref:RxLR effector protein n=1 Tax=Phytophthora palmivora TaxID=4796 RepID=A0A2P4WW46_9STRA|nr:RxLR effector family protein [Phytophthora palmivora]
MSFCQFLLQVTVVLLVSCNPGSASKNSMPSEFSSSTHVLESHTPTNRYLRAYTTSEGDNEERGISVKLPTLEQISNTLKSSKRKELEGLLKGDELVGDAFKKLKLSTMPIGNPKTQSIETKDVVKLFSSTNFKVWSDHVSKWSELNKKNPADTMLTALTSVFGEKEVAIMILLSKKSWRTGTVVKDLEKAQFNKWFNKILEPRRVYEDVLGANWRLIHGNPREKQIWLDYTAYSMNRVAHH